MIEDLDALPAKIRESEWRPRPRAVPGLRRILADHITDPDWRSSPTMTDSSFPVVQVPIAMQQELREADLFFIDAAVAQTVSYLAHAQRQTKRARLGTHVRTLSPNTPPALRGFLVFGLPVAWQSEIFEVTAVSWASSDDTPSGGVDLIAWAALTHAAVDTSMRMAGTPDEARERQKAYALLGPLLPVARRSWAYQQTISSSAEEWVGAVQATWAAMATQETIETRGVRPGWTDAAHERQFRRCAASTYAPVALEVSTSTVCRSVLTPPGPGGHPSVGGS